AGTAKRLAMNASASDILRMVVPLENDGRIEGIAALGEIDHAIRRVGRAARRRRDKGNGLASGRAEATELAAFATHPDSLRGIDAGEHQEENQERAELSGHCHGRKMKAAFWPAESTLKYSARPAESGVLTVAE